MSIKTLFIINEPFEKMAVGKNTTLSYITAAFEMGHDVYIANLDKAESFPRDLDSSIITIKLDKKSGSKLAINYKRVNKSIVAYTQKKEYSKLQTITPMEVGDLLKEIDHHSLLLKEVNLIIQRLEPMKAPFPPQGNQNVDDVLRKIRAIVPKDIIFNCPIGVGDKEIPQRINRILLEKNEEAIAIPTANFKLGDDNLSPVFQSMIEQYHMLYQNGESKIVLKPENSAQTLGVFALEFSQDGMDLNAIKTQSVGILGESKTYKIKENSDEKELRDIVNILCFIQRVRNKKALFNKLEKQTIADISPEEMLRLAKELYNEAILVQPFLEGVKSGDIRVNYLKNNVGDFYVAGSVFRSSSKKKDKTDFTTGYITGNAVSKPLSRLFFAEESDVFRKSDKVLEIINGQLKEEYRNITEFGADFILVGDNKTSLLGEINHHCQGLVPIAEAMEKASHINAAYDGGLLLAKKFVKDMLALQKSLA